jgi:hypothetical protein
MIPLIDTGADILAMAIAMLNAAQQKRLCDYMRLL